MNPNQKEYTPIQSINEFDDSARHESFIPNAIPVQNPQELDSYSTQQPFGYVHVDPQIKPPRHIPQHPLSHPQYAHYLTQNPHYVPQNPHYVPQIVPSVTQELNAEAYQFVQSQSQYQKTNQPASLNELALMLARNDDEINEFRFFVMVNWIVICLITAGALIGVLLLIMFSSIAGLACHQSRNSDCTGVLAGIGLPIVLVIVLLIFVVSGVLSYLHYLGVQIFREKKEKSMECMFVGYSIFLAMNVLSLNCIGIAIYGYLAFSSYKLKALFKRRQEIERQISFASGQRQQNIQVLLNPLPVLQPQFIQMAQF